MNTIFNNIYNNNWDKAKDILKDNIDIIDLNIEINNIYLIELIIINNRYDIFEIINNKNIYFEIYTKENMPIIFNLIKYNYTKLLELILDKKNIIGLSILDIKNNLGENILLYSIKVNNNITTNIILKYITNFDISNNSNNTLFHYISKFNDINILKKIDIKKNINLINKQNSNGETCLHIAINYINIDIIYYLLKNNIDIFIKDFEYEFTVIHYIIIKNDVNLLNYIIDNYDIYYNTPDIYGRTYLHFLVIYNMFDILEKILIKNKNIKYNTINIKGYTILHLTLLSLNNSNSNNLKNLLKILIKNTNLNIQDIDGNSCLYYLVTLDIIDDYYDVLVGKKLDLYIYNNNNELIYDLIKNNNKFINLLVDNYYNKITNNNKYITNNLDECFNNKNIKICKEKIKNLIIKDKISFPISKNKTCIKIEKPQKVGYVSYSGTNLDIICGLYYLETTFDNVKTSLSNNFIENIKLIKYYKKINKKIDKLSDFNNIEILWNKQKLILVDGFDKIIKFDKRFIIIPIGIENEKGFHSNILIIDNKLKTIERFEPNGASGPIGYFYNSELLDLKLKLKLKKYLDDYKYKRPKDYLPKIGLQIYESLEEKKKQLGDPGGFCSSWSLWYSTLVLKYPDIKREKLINKIIYNIKKNQISFKDLIRNFTVKIIVYRDIVLKNTNIDINDWINNNYDEKSYKILVNNIYKLINSLL